MQQVIAFVTAVAITVLLEAILLFLAEWHFLWVTLIGFCFSLAAEHVVRLIMSYQKGAKSLWQYFLRMKK